MSLKPGSDPTTASKRVGSMPLACTAARNWSIVSGAVDQTPSKADTGAEEAAGVASRLADGDGGVPAVEGDVAPGAAGVAVPQAARSNARTTATTANVVPDRCPRRPTRVADDVGLIDPLT